MADVEKNVVANSLSCLLSELLLSWLNHSQHIHMHTTYTPTSSWTYDQGERERANERESERERETCFHLQDKWFLLDNLLMLIWENPLSRPCTPTHTRAHTLACIHVDTFKYTHTQSCKYMWRQQSPANVQVWTTSATGPATHTCTDTVILPQVQTKPGLVFHHQTHIQIRAHS